MQSTDLFEISQKYPEYTRQVNQNYRRNYLLVLFDSALFAFVLAMLSVDTIIPYLVSHLTEQRFWVGVASAIYFWGFFFPQFIGAYLVHGKPRRKWTIFWIAIAERVAILMIAILLQVINWLTPANRLTLFFLAYAIFSVTNGLIAPAYSDFISKNINRNRGQFYGFLNGLSGLIGFGASLLARNVLDRSAFPENLQLLFWLAFASSFVSPFLIVNFREVPYPVVGKAEPLGHFVRAIPGVLRRFLGFRRYLVTRSLLGLGLMANSFYAIYAVRTFDMSEGTFGLYTMIILLTQSILGFAWGWVGDHFGFKRVYVLAGVLLIAQALLALTSSAGWVFYLVAFCTGGIYASFSTADPNMVFEIAPPAETSRFVGMANTLLSPVLAAAPLVGGLLVDQFSYNALFAVTLVIGIAGIMVAVFVLPDPRWAHLDARMADGAGKTD